MKKLLNFFVNNYVVILMVLILVGSSMSMICENDLFFDLKTGEDILKNGLTFDEHFSFVPGLTYVYLHWFYDIFIFLVYSVFSWTGLYIMFIIITSLFYIIYYNEIYKLKKDKLLSFIITFIVFWISRYAFISRVQSIVYLLLFLEVLYLEKLYKTGNKKYSIYLVLLSILVVNLQMPIWIFYIILTLPYIAEVLFSKILKNKFDKCSNYKLFYTTILLIILSGLISPYGLIPYTYCLKSLNNPIYNMLELLEMQHTVLIECKNIIYITIVFILGLYFKYLKMPLRDFCLMCGLFLFSIIVYKNVIFYLYFGIYIIVKNIDFTIIKNKFELIYNRINVTVIEVLLIIVCSFFSLKVFNNKTKNFDKYGYNSYPSGIVEYLKKNTDYKNIKLFTQYNTGSFYLFNDLKTFVDSRAEVFMKEYNGGKDILMDYIKIKYPEYTAEIINKYNFDYYAVEYGDEIFKYLNKTEGFCVVDRFQEYTLIEVYKEKKFIKN